jgi:transposase-like protein
LDAREQMVAIKSTLGLNVTELAAILGVQRPTVYAWQAGAAEPHSENGARLRRLYEVALEWSRGCAEPLGGWVRTPLDGSGRSLVTLLSEAAPDAATIVEALRSLRVRIERDAAAMAGVSERARRRGYQDRAQGRQDSAADRETLV